MKLLKRIVLIVLLIIFLSFIAIYLWLRTTAPTYEGHQELKGLTEEVKVFFDDYGIPHLYAQSAEDAYKALGYVHAQDRLFQMEMIRRATSGTLAEILGEALIPTDKLMRTLSIRKAAINSASKAFETIDAPYKKQTLAYLEGINQFIDEDRLPLEFKLIGFKPEHFSIEDVFITIGYMSLSFTSAISEEPLLTRIHNELGNAYMIDLGLDTTGTNTANTQETKESDIISQILAPLHIQELLPVPIWEGSNNWAISKERSVSGKALLANDTHIKYAQPAVWYEAHINYPGFEMFGYYLAGVPFAIIGHNDRLGWGTTIFPFDNMDLYRETSHPDNPMEYLVDDQWKAFQLDIQTIYVKDAEPVSYHLKYSHHGPILNEVYPHIGKEEQQPISLWWSLHNLENKSLEALYLMNNASDITAFEEAVSLVDIIGQNIVYADADDNIAWWASGRIPIRSEGINSKLILDGSHSKNDITGYYDFEKNPQMINPESGILVTANNKPHAVDGLVYPGYYAPGLRAERLSILLNTRNTWDLESMRQLQLDNLSERDTMIRNLIMNSLAINEINSEGESFAHALKYFKDWDGKSGVGSVGATIYNQILYHVLYNAMADELGANYFDKNVSRAVVRSGIRKLVTNESSIWWDNVSTAHTTESRTDAFTAAVYKSISSLKEQLGDNPSLWQWGRVHTLTHIHPIGRQKPFNLLFNVGPFAMAGSNDVIDKESFKYNSSGEYAVGSGPAMRFLLDFSNTDAAWSVIPTGQSGNVMSLHYDDQARMFVEGSYRKQIMDKNELQDLKLLILSPLEKE